MSFTGPTGSLPKNIRPHGLDFAAADCGSIRWAITVHGSACVTGLAAVIRQRLTEKATPGERRCRPLRRVAQSRAQRTGSKIRPATATSRVYRPGPVFTQNNLDDAGRDSETGGTGLTPHPAAGQSIAPGVASAED